VEPLLKTAGFSRKMQTDTARVEFFALPSPLRPFALSLLIQAPVQLKRSADKRHMSKGLREITQLFC
jgi:hypothetical protein